MRSTNSRRRIGRRRLHLVEEEEVIDQRDEPPRLVTDDPRRFEDVLVAWQLKFYQLGEAGDHGQGSLELVAEQTEKIALRGGNLMEIARCDLPGAQRGLRERRLVALGDVAQVADDAPHGGIGEAVGGHDRHPAPRSICMTDAHFTASGVDRPVGRLNEHRRHPRQVIGWCKGTTSTPSTVSGS